MMQAEFVACYKAVEQIMWLKGFIPGLRVVDNISKLLKLYYDNRAAVFYASKALPNTSTFSSIL
jgi:hypothetical protein